VSGDILDEIDRAVAGYEVAVDDYGVSADAMRCAPLSETRAARRTGEDLWAPDDLARIRAEVREVERLVRERRPTSPAAPRTPQVDPVRDGCLRVPFVGGHRHQPDGEVCPTCSMGWRDCRDVFWPCEEYLDAVAGLPNLPEEIARAVPDC